ncbi:MAG: hypothetical protein ACKOTA_09680 [Solirubrobacterales bacterium]
MALLAFGSSPAAANGCITPAAGTAGDPYLINNLNNLLCLRNNTSYWTGGKHFKQTADIDLSGQAVWISTIGTNAIPVTGTYDGDGHEITGLQVDLTGAHGAPPATSNAGLFGKTNGATLTDLKIHDAAISLTPSGSYYAAGILAGEARATTITDVHTSGTVAGQGSGGLAGDGNFGTRIDASSSSASITGNDWCAGGLVGCGANDLTISDSHASGEVTGDIFVGGLVGGFWQTGLIERSYATGEVTGRPAAPGTNGCCSGYVGGLVGLVASEPAGRVAIAESFATGAVTQEDSVAPTDTNLCGGCVGGLVGVLHSEPSSPENTIADSYASGTVTAGIAGGGLVGTANAGNPQITRSYSRSALRGAGTAQFGGLVGKVSSGTPSVTASFWNATDADHATSGSLGTQSTQAAMRTPAPFSSAGWDITDTLPTTSSWASWAAHNDGYPFLGWYAVAQGWTCAAAPPPPVTAPEDPPGAVPDDPTPAPLPDKSGSGSNSFTARASKVSGSTIRTRITVPGPGRLSQRGTRSRGSGAAASVSVCRTSRVAGNAGTYTLTCAANRTTRSARRRGAVRVTLRTSFVPTGGTARTTSRTVTLSSRNPSFTG